jgi:hypothetical protein
MKYFEVIIVGIESAPDGVEAAEVAATVAERVCGLMRHIGIVSATEVPADASRAVKLGGMKEFKNE